MELAQLNFGNEWSGFVNRERESEMESPWCASIFLLIANYEARSIICSGWAGREWLQIGGQSLIKEILICLMSSASSVRKINGNMEIRSTNSN